MKIKDFQTFLNENTGGLHKVIMCVSKTISDFDYVTDKGMYTRNYMTLFSKGDKPFKADMPVINFCNLHTQRLLDAGTPEDIIYNPKAKKQEISSKVRWHEIHKDSKFVPKTVSEPEDIDQLKFPIIAKPDNRYSGMGIQKFDTLEDAKKADLSDFEVFSEKIDIDEEHRIIMWRGEPLQWVQRVHGNKETKEMTKKKEDKLYFKYVLKDVNKMPEEWNEVFQEMNEAHEGLDIYSIDLAVDKEGKPHVIEMSSEFAPLYGVMAFIYKKVYQDYYNKKLHSTEEEQIDMYQKKDIDSTLSFNKKFKNRFSVDNG